MRLNKITLIFLILAAFALTGCDVTLAGDVTPPPNIEPEAEMPAGHPEVDGLEPETVEDFDFTIVPDTDFGAVLFTENCASCHGPDGLGTSMAFNGEEIPVSPIGDPDYRAAYTPQEWYALITEGNMAEMMPPFKDLLTPEQRWAAVGYTFGLNTEEAAARGVEVFAQNCASCHGDTGAGDGPKSANMNPKPADFTHQTFMSLLSNTDLLDGISRGTASDMPSFAGRLTDAEIADLTLFIRSLVFPAADMDAVGETEPMDEQPPTTVEEPELEVASPELDAQGIFTADIVGQVIFAEGMAPVDGLQVSLLGVDPSGNGQTLESTADADGNFIFEDIQMGHGWQFLTAAIYNGNQFPSDEALNVIEPQESYSFIIRLQETTSAVDSLVFETIHFYVDFPNEDTAQIVQAVTISNMGDKMVVPKSDTEPVITFQIPANATNLGFMDQNASAFIRGVPGGIGDLNYVPVGENTYSLIYYYEIPFEGKIDFSYSLPFDANEVILILPPEGYSVESEQLTSRGLETGAGNDQRMLYGVELLQTGDEISFTAARDSGLAGLGGISFNMEILLGGLGLIAAVGGIAYWIQRSRADGDEDFEEEDSQDVLLEKIVALDEQFSLGNISEHEYRESRAALKSALADLLED